MNSRPDFLPHISAGITNSDISDHPEVRRYKKLKDTHKMPAILGRMTKVCSEITKTAKGLTDLRDKMERLREASGGSSGSKGRGNKKGKTLAKALAR